MKRNEGNNRDQLQNSNMDRGKSKMQSGMQQHTGHQRTPQGKTNTQPSGSRSSSSDMEELERTKGTVGSRQTGDNAEDRAGVADIDKRLKR